MDTTKPKTLKQKHMEQYGKHLYPYIIQFENGKYLHWASGETDNADDAMGFMIERQAQYMAWRINGTIINLDEQK